MDNATSDPIRLIDVGARGGIHERWEPFYGLLEVRAFEPDPQECAVLNTQSHPYSIHFLPMALGAKDGEQATLFVCRQPGCSSLLPPNIALCRAYQYGHGMEVVGQEPLVLTRLDTACRDFPPDVLKIDTQGTELDVLRGAGQLLDDILAVELEVEFVPQYLGQPLFGEVDSFMRGQGFTLRGLRRTCWREKTHHLHPYGGQLVHGDALYLRPERMDGPKGHIILAAYRQYDLLERFGATHLIPRRSWLVRLTARLLSGQPHWELRRFVDRLRPPKATDWRYPDFF